MKFSTAPVILKEDFQNEQKKHELVVVHPVFPLENKINLYVKRFLDILLSFTGIVFLLSWLCPVIAIFIRVDSKGPVFFLQKRNKRGGKVFTCIKFRTMVLNPEADLLPAAPGDHRITAAGRFLRRYHLDELPQLFNVFSGDMSLIGPRPYMLSENDRFGSVMPLYSYRYKVKPGMTGLAQMLGNCSSNHMQLMQERLNKDLYYINHWSPLLDLKILGRTFLRILGR